MTLSKTVWSPLLWVLVILTAAMSADPLRGASTNTARQSQNVDAVAPAATPVMKAVRIHQFGGPEVLRYEEVERPTAKSGEVVIRVHAAGVNPADWQTRSGGGVARRFKNSLPVTLGWDVSGIVAAVGSGTADYRIGDAVFGFIGFPDEGGAYAEYASAAATEIAHKPRSLTHVQAAGLPLVSLTAWQALLEAGGLSKRQSVLIHAAAGGVGHIAVQLAKWKGAYVVGTASARNEEFLHEIGVDRFVNYRTTRFAEVVRGVDMILDPFGGETRARSWQSLKKGGILVSLKGGIDTEVARIHDVNAVGIIAKPNGSQLAKIAELVEAGHVRPHISRVFPLSAAAEAHKLSQGGHTRGKIVLEIH